MVEMLLFFLLTKISAHAIGFGELKASVNDNDNVQQRLIFPPDSRQEKYQLTSPNMIKAANATAGMIYEKMISYDHKSDSFQLKAQSFEERHGTCPGHRFAQQPAPVLCTGFLIGKRTLVSAGHCMLNPYDCAHNLWVFGLAYDSAEQKSFNIHSSHIYRCQRVIDVKWDAKSKIDYAIIELERDVQGRDPLFVGSGHPEMGQELFMPGHGGGLPLKMTSEAKVVGNGHTHYFQASLDALGGNSGSPVINADTGEVEGILVRAGNAPEWQVVTTNGKDHGQSCKREFVCDNTCSGVEVTRISSLF